MARFDETQAQCFVLTFKEGLLSPVAHDLRISVTRFHIDAEETRVFARFDTASLVVDTPMKEGTPNPSALSAGDKAKISRQIREDVLHSRSFPEATFRSTSVRKRPDGGYDVAGELTLHGVTRPLLAQTQLAGGKQHLELRIHQPDFGITPYKAMLGTLKVQADVTVQLRL